MKILLLYKGYMANQTLRDGYRTIIDNYLGSTVQFDFAKLNYQGRKKVPANEIREWAKERIDVFNQYDYLLLADADYFKVITKNKKAEVTLGMMQNAPEINSKVFYCPSPAIYQMDREKHQNQFQRVLEGIKKDTQGKSTVIEPEIVTEDYPANLIDIKNWLDKLQKQSIVFCDIEARSLNVTKAGIYTIGFAWNKHEGICFSVDSHSEPEKVKDLLREFFNNYKGKLVFHKANYDVPVLIYNLYMNNDLFNIEGQLNGLNKIFKENNLDDTLVIAYLATNSCSGNILGLKELAQPYVGEYAVDVSDVTQVPIKELLKYNLIDCLATAYVYETYYPIMVKEEQEQYYKDYVIHWLKGNIRMQLNGLPINLSLVQSFKTDLLEEQSKLLNYLYSTTPVKNAELLKAEYTTQIRNSKLKTKVTTINDNYKSLNFNSIKDLIILVHEIMNLPVISTTETGMSSLGKKELKNLKNHTENEEYKEVLQTIADLKDVEKIVTAFIPAFETAYCNNNQCRLLGYFNLGGTVSGRLSSSNINLQQLPSSGSRFAKPVKKLFTSTKEWLFVGIDFSSLILGEHYSNVLC